MVSSTARWVLAQSHELRLGEASGVALAVPLLRAALACHTGMTFAEAGVSDKPSDDGEGRGG